MAIIMIENSKVAIDPGAVVLLDLKTRIVTLAGGAEMKLTPEDFDVVFAAKKEGK